MTIKHISKLLHRLHTKKQSKLASLPIQEVDAASNQLFPGTNSLLYYQSSKTIKFFRGPYNAEDEINPIKEILKIQKCLELYSLDIEHKIVHTTGTPSIHMSTSLAELCFVPDYVKRLASIDYNFIVDVSAYQLFVYKGRLSTQHSDVFEQIDSELSQEQELLHKLNVRASIHKDTFNPKFLESFG